MKKITYTPLGTISAVENSPKDRHVICLAGCEGRLEIGGLTLELCDGAVCLHPSQLPDGRYTPVWTYAGKSTPLQSLQKLGRALYPATPDIEEYSRFVASVTELMQKISALEAEVNKLSLLVEGATIFNI